MNNDKKLELANRLNNLLESRRLSKAWLAKQTGVTDVAIGKIINGKTKEPTQSLVEKIATALNVSSDYLWNGNAEEQKQQTNLSRIKQFISEQKEKLAKNLAPDKDDLKKAESELYLASGEAQYALKQFNDALEELQALMREAKAK